MVAARHVVELAPQNLVSLQALSAITYYRGAYDEAEIIQRQALALNANDPETLAQLGWRLAMRGRWQEGLGYLTQAISRTIDPPAWYYFSFAVHDYFVCCARLYRRRLCQSLGCCRKGEKGWRRRRLVACRHDPGGARRPGRSDQGARRDGGAILLVAARPRRLLPLSPLREPIVDRLVDGLRKAGWKQPNAQAAAAEK